MSPLHTLLDAAVLTAVDDDAPAIVTVASDAPSRTVSRAQFRTAVARAAGALAALGIRPGDLVIIAHTQNLESIYLFWGALRCGAIPSMFPTLTEKLDPDVYREQMAILVRRSGVAAVFTSDAFAPLLAGLSDCPVYGSSDLPADPAPAPPFSPDPDAVAFLQHSSGTTGLQKGVALSHRAVANQLAAYGAALALSADDVVVSWLPLYHDMGLIAGFMLPLAAGLPLVLLSPFDWVRHPALLLRAISDHGGTLCWLPNFAYNHSVRRIRERDLAGVSLAGMRLFVNCSEPVRAESHRAFLERFGPLGVEARMLGVSYAMAENTFGVTQTDPHRPVAHFVIDRHLLASSGEVGIIAEDAPGALVHVSCGPPIPGTELRIVDSQGTVLPERRVGEIALRSNCMLSGYYRRPDLDPFSDGWYLTGDRGYLIDGELVVIGRAKDLIINAGKNIFPQDIEAIVNQVAGVHPGRAVVFGVFDQREGTELIAVVAESEQAADEKRHALGRAIRQAVAGKSMVTASFVTIVPPGWLLKTSSGKLARAANREKWLAERNR